MLKVIRGVLARARKRSSLVQKMRGDWDLRARENHRLHIATGHADSDEAFSASGLHDLNEVILDGLALGEESVALEIGCGVGRLLAPLSTRAGRVIGVDIAPTMIEKAREYCKAYPNISVLLTEGGLGEPSRSVDFIYSYIVFQHIPAVEPIEAYLRDAARVLRPGGVLRFQVDGRWQERGAWKHDTYDGVVFSRSSIRQLVERVGLSVVEEWGEDTHYYRLTGKAPGSSDQNPHVFPSSIDAQSVAALLEAAEVGSSPAAVDAILRRETSVREALRGRVAQLARGSNRDYVKALYGLLLFRAPEEPGLRYHTEILDRNFEDHGALLDTILTGIECRSLLRPFAQPEWSIALSLRQRFGDALPKESTTQSLCAFLLDSFAQLPFEAFVEQLVSCVDPAEDKDLRVAEYAELAARKEPAIRRALTLRLLGRQRVPPGPPKRATQDRLRAATGCADSAPHRRGESFRGEAFVAEVLFHRTASASDADVVSQVYETLFQRPPDAEGAMYYGRLLSEQRLTRGGFLRELLWSDELRGS
ncbi:MAG: class I SAM-dependent methyltransferase [Thermoanaerobaculia bacterium]